MAVVSCPAKSTRLLYTEQNIRGLAISFLRQHYRLRPRKTTTGTRVVTKAHYYKGVTIDARLSYQQPDGTWFMATVEATSNDKANELLYRVNWFRVTAHALLLALLLAVLFLAGTQVQGLSVFTWWGRPEVYALLPLTFAVTWFLAGAVLSRSRGYRFIYAIAQFKRFHADAQWVAYDREIFFPAPAMDPESPSVVRHYRRMQRFYEELHRQCVTYGFGMLEIRADHEVIRLLEPSRIDQFGGQRSQLPQWVQRIQAPPVVERLGRSLPFGKNFAPARRRPQETPAAAPDAPADPLDIERYLPQTVREVDYREAIVPVSGKPRPWYQQPGRYSKHLRWQIRHAYRSLFPPEIRNRPTYYALAWPSRLAVLLLAAAAGTLLYLQSRADVTTTPGTATAVEALTPLEPATSPATADASPELLPGEYDHELSARTARQRAARPLNAERVVDSELGARQQAVVLEISPAHQAVAYYDCLPLFLAEGTLFLIEEGRYTDYATAVARAEALNEDWEVAVGVAARRCLDPLAENYFIYLGGVQATEAAANLRLRRLQRLTGETLRIVLVE